jgi:hypothetical protein
MAQAFPTVLATVGGVGSLISVYLVSFIVEAHARRVRIASIHRD